MNLDVSKKKNSVLNRKRRMNLDEKKNSALSRKMRTNWDVSRKNWIWKTMMNWALNRMTNLVWMLKNSNSDENS